MSEITFNTITELQEAEEAWKTLSLNEVLYDNWDFRYLYYQFLQYPLEFIAAYDNGELVGLLPLMWDEEKGHLDFFAGVNFMEDNRIFVEPGYEFLRHELLKRVSKPAFLNYLHEEINISSQAEIHAYTYYADLAHVKNYSDYIEKTFSGKTKNTLKRQLKKLQENNLVFSENDSDDIDTLIKFNKERFGEKSSFYKRTNWSDFYKAIAAKFHTKTLSISINNEKKAVGFGIIYKNTYVMINSGADIEFDNLRKFTNLFLIDQAIKSQTTIYDAGSGSFGWKEYFKLIPKPQYQIDLRNTFAYDPGYKNTKGYKFFIK